MELDHSILLRRTTIKVSRKPSSRITNVINKEVFPKAACALYKFNTIIPGDLCFLKGDLITVTRRVDELWLEGYVAGFGNHCGILPECYIELLTNNENHRVCKALYTFRGGEQGDLSFEKGQELMVLNQINSEWLYGHTIKAPGSLGIFPSRYVS